MPEGLKALADDLGGAEDLFGKTESICIGCITNDCNSWDVSKSSWDIFRILSMIAGMWPTNKIGCG